MLFETASVPLYAPPTRFSEAQFKTLKSRPEFPERFGSAEAARAFCHPFFTWYNTEHRHGGIGWLTPAMVHYGPVEAVRTARRQVLTAAYAAHPERFVQRPPTPPTIPAAVWINPPAPSGAPASSNAGATAAPLETAGVRQ